MGRRAGLVAVCALAALTAGLLVLFLSDDTAEFATQDEVIEALEAIPAPSEDAEDDFPAIVDSAVRDIEEREFPESVEFEILATIPHDVGAFTQGLEISDGRLFESTGLVGESTIRELSPATGEVLRSLDVPDVFAEGLTLIEGPETTAALQLTWQNGLAYRYDAETFAVTDTFSYDGEGWGLCHDGDRLVMSDGSPTLQFRDDSSFELVDTVQVTFSGVPVDELNELECVNGLVWANIWKSSLIVEIDPESGLVTRVLNARSLTPEGYEGRGDDVLNGIAYDPQTDTFLLTGKRWPVIYRVRLA